MPTTQHCTRQRAEVPFWCPLVCSPALVALALLGITPWAKAPFPHPFRRPSVYWTLPCGTMPSPAPGTVLSREVVVRLLVLHQRGMGINEVPNGRRWRLFGAGTWPPLSPGGLAGWSPDTKDGMVWDGMDIDDKTDPTRQTDRQALRTDRPSIP
jgi:hypothetical protein